MVWVRERTIPTERPPLVGEAIANFCGERVPRGQRDGSLRPYSRFSRQEPLLFYQVAPRLYSRGWVDPVPDPLLFFLVVPGIEPGPPDLKPRTLTTRPQRRSYVFKSEQFSQILPNIFSTREGLRQDKCSACEYRACRLQWSPPYVTQLTSSTKRWVIFRYGSRGPVKRTTGREWEKKAK
jgi:hypothetical protein